MEIVKLSKSGLKKDIENGMKRTDMATKYGLATTQINKAIKQAGLSGMRAKTIKFVLEDDEEMVEEVPIQEQISKIWNSPSENDSPFNV